MILIFYRYFIGVENIISKLAVQEEKWSEKEK